MIATTMTLARGGVSSLLKIFKDQPLVFGAVIVVVGLGLIGYGVYEIRRGFTYTRNGKKYRGKGWKTMSFVKIIGGIICLAFAIYKMIVGS